MKIEAARQEVIKNFQEKGKRLLELGTAWNYYSGSEIVKRGRKSEKNKTD